MMIGTLMISLIAMPLFEIFEASKEFKKVGTYFFIMQGPPAIIGLAFYFWARKNNAMIEFFGHSVHLTFVILVYLIKLKVIPWEST